MFWYCLGIVIILVVSVATDVLGGRYFLLVPCKRNVYRLWCCLKMLVIDECCGCDKCVIHRL